MSQETLMLQTTPSHPLITTTTWFQPAKPPQGYEALPCDAPEDHADVELCAPAKPPPDIDVEASPIPSPSPAAFQVRDTTTTTTTTTTTSPHARPSAGPKTRPILGVLQMLAIFLTAGLPSALLCSALIWLFGMGVLRSFDVAPYASMDAGAALQASMAGAPVVALAVGALAFLDFAVRRLPRLRARVRIHGRGAGYTYDQASDVVAVLRACAPASVFAMPLGFLMLPRLATETFGAWHALGCSVVGLGAPVASFCLPVVLGWLWCGTVKL